MRVSTRRLRRTIGPRAGVRGPVIGLLVGLTVSLGACGDGGTESGTSAGASAEPGPEAVARGLLRAVVVEGREETFTMEERMAHYAVPGISVAVLRDGRVAWARGWGTADAETGARVTPRTLFQAASISKPVAALAALSLVEEGALTLDGPIRDHLAGWELPENEFTADSAVTLRHLLTHSAGTTVWGFPGYRKDQPFAGADGEGRSERMLATNAEVLEGRGNTDSVRVFKEPGTSWRYSGGGYTVVEQAVEDVSGLPFEEAARRRVLEPAGMVHSTYAQPLPRNRWTEAARAHDTTGEELPGEWHNYPEQAAAGLWTTPTDLLTLSAHLLAILRGDEETEGVLSRSMLEAALTPHHPGEERYQGWGLGFSLDDAEGTETFGHGGSNAGFKAQWTVHRASGDGIAVMTNGERGTALAAEVIRAAAWAYGWPRPRPSVRAVRSTGAEDLRELEGVYQMVDRPEVELEIRAWDDSLTVDVSTQGRATLLPAAEPAGEFFDPDDGSVLTFLRGDGGEVIAAANGSGQRFARRIP